MDQDQKNNSQQENPNKSGPYYQGSGEQPPMLPSMPPPHQQQPQQYYPNRPEWTNSNEMHYQNQQYPKYSLVNPYNALHPTHRHPSYEQLQQNSMHPMQQQQQQHPMVEYRPVDHPLTDDSMPQKPIRKRKRNFTACDACRVKKVKCNLDKPTCGSCLKSGSSCIYRPPIKPTITSATTTTSNTKQLKTEIPPPSQTITEPSTIAQTKVENKSEILKLVESQNKLEKWSSCNWIASAEETLTWPILEDKYQVSKQINTKISEATNTGLPDLNMFTESDINQILDDLAKNLHVYMNNFNENIQTKNPLVDFQDVHNTVEFFENANTQNFKILDFKPSEDLIPLPMLLMMVAGSLIAKPLTFRNLVDFRNSLAEKEDVFELSFKYYTLANYLNQFPRYKINPFDIRNVQFLLLNANYWMYNMKPFKGWHYVFRSSTTVITILESLKDSKKKFTEQQHRILERVFYSCLRYECELRVELSPFVPSSGIANYNFPKLYPTPPLNGSMEKNEELSWFFCLTEIIFRRLENRILDEFYIPSFKNVDYNQQKDHNEYLGDKYSLNWSELNLEQTIARVEEYFKEISQIEKAIQAHLDTILDSDEYNTDDVSKPHGFAFQNVKLSTPDSSANVAQTPQMTSMTPKQLPMTPKSSFTPASSTSTETFKRRIPEALNFTRTRVITVRLFLYRPIIYLFIHSPIPNEMLLQNPVVIEFLKQCEQSMDLLSVPLSSHRHYGSWFFLRNMFCYVSIMISLYKRFGTSFAPKEKVTSFLKDCLIMFNFWLEESPDFADARKFAMQALSSIDEGDEI